jgi:hypothetical protein
VSKVAGGSRGTAHDHAVDERRTTDSRAESEQNHVATPSSGSPQHLGDKGRACVIVSTDPQAIHSGQLAQRASFQKIQVAGQAINARGGRIDHSFTANPDTLHSCRRVLSHGVDKIPERRSCARRVRMKALEQVSAQSHQGSLDRGSPDVDADCDRFGMSR